MDLKTKKPNLFIVGAPKCGTTSLHYYLKQHPDIFMSEPKELNYFCKDFHREAEGYLGGKNDFFRYKKENEYLKIFKSVKNEKVIGETSPRYYFSREAAREIYNFNPEAKIIIILRNPIDMIKSQHAQFVKSGHEKIEDFSRAIKLEESRRKGRDLPEDLDQPSLLYYSDIGFIKKNIQRYLDLFPRDNIKIILLDDFKYNLEGVYRDVLSFLEIDNKNFQPDFKTKNTRGLPRFKFITYFFRSNSLLKRLVRKIISHKYRERIYYFLERLNTKKVSDEQKKEIDGNIKKELKDRFKTDVEFLSSLLNVDLVKKWDY